MQKLKDKTMAILIAAVLAVSIGTSTGLFATTSAHSPSINQQTWAVISAAPDQLA